MSIRRTFQPASHAPAQSDPEMVIGVSGKVTVVCDPATDAQGVALAQRLLGAVAGPFADMEAFFGVEGSEVTVVVAPLGVRNGSRSGGGCEIAIHVDPTSTASDPLQLAIGLYVAGLSARFMAAQGKGWAPGYSNGEGLARFLAEHETVPGTFDACATGPLWAAANFPDWVSHTEQDGRDGVACGCAVVYLHWMRAIGYTIAQIVQAGGATLLANYRALTGRVTALADLKAAVAGLVVTTDNPFAVSAQAPALAILGNELLAAWKGTDGDDGIHWMTRSPAASWSAPTRIPMVATSAGPGIASVGCSVVMAWKGAKDDRGILWSSFNGSTWALPRRIPGAITSVGPKLAVFDGRVSMIWKGDEGDDGIWWSTLARNVWSSPLRVPNMASAAAPALAVFGTRLYAAWRGGFGDESLWYTFYDGFIWAPPRRIPNAVSSHGPMLAVHANRLYAAWKGGLSDPGISWSAFDGQAWAPQQRIVNTATNAGPALASFCGALYALWKGESDDERLFFSTFNGLVWAPSQPIAQVAIRPSRSAVAQAAFA